ncbi:HesA/MoeB/ThiF family protein [Salegentibacter salegens]|uniref:Molybdopterin-synthase adenylyltransferase n=1 Tax=Salegentibacter salegens TaxID=143223 RepID=A0A1M7L2T8_9FLAO|nr:HesA/MoeB/ThiF family protein [Salegentibacter salegens]PRX44832.1 adenylyltransferase/sulfurtransferase [Salegentibacter salegens]SHM72251.1 adenylyltransferase and sulfurtransferase [Salegentibacter salegens]
MNRFSRQTILPDFGAEGQQKLSQARVLVVGAGGLGCPALLHLAAAGVGTIGIVDGDIISESNLNRQTLFGHQHIGRPKASTAAEILKEKYPDLKFEIFSDFLNTNNALEIISQFDLIVDGTDNFGTRYLVNDVCVLLEKPLVMGAIYKYEGQLMIFNYGPAALNYRDVYPNPPGENQIPNCAETGVLGVLPGIIGTLQASEVIKILSGVGKVLSEKILFFNLKNSSFYEVAIQPNLKGRKNLPDSEDDFRSRDYKINCGIAEHINWEKALDWTFNMNNSVLVDIRETGEKPLLKKDYLRNMPQGELRENPELLSAYENILLVCASGQRSAQLATELKQQFPEKKIFSVEGGILHPSSPLNSNKNDT